MDSAILSAVIALAGVVISVLITFYSTRLTVRNEIEKLEASIIQNYSSKILDERNKRYPEIYFELSQMAKLIKSNNYNIGRPKIDAKLIQEFIFKLDEYNSRSSVFFSSSTGSISNKLRLFSYKLLSDLRDSEDGIDLVLNEKRINEFMNLIGNLEVGLKKDLGIFVIEFQDPKHSTSYLSYHELKMLREQRYNKDGA